MSSNCRICHNSEALTHFRVEEKMMGSGDAFDYFQCPACGCLQISDIPDNLSGYYAGGYYSYRRMKRLEHAPLRRWGDTHRVNAGLGGKDVIGAFFNAVAKPLEYLPWVIDGGIDRNARVLDVGSGQGRLLLRMALGGFSRLTGIDPFVEQDIHYDNGVTVLKQELQTLAATGQQFDFIMLHHSLEHMPAQAEALQAATQLLAPGGVILLRIPLSDSYAWEHYRENWVQLDAPRHLYLHSRRSVALLAEQCGLQIDKVIDDSSKFQFTGSELYKQGIALNTAKRDRKIFSKAQLRQFSRQANELNAQGRGDQAAFYLRKGQ